MGKERADDIWGSESESLLAGSAFQKKIGVLLVLLFGQSLDILLLSANPAFWTVRGEFRK